MNIYIYIYTHGYPPHTAPLENSLPITKVHTLPRERVAVYWERGCVCAKGRIPGLGHPCSGQSASQPAGQLQYCSPSPNSRQAGRNLANKTEKILVLEIINQSCVMLIKHGF